MSNLFDRPEAFVWLIPGVILILVCLRLAYVQARQGYHTFGEQALAPSFSRAINRRFDRRQLIRLCAIWLLLLVAYAGPSVAGEPALVQQGTLNIVAVIDTSNSMANEAYRGGEHCAPGGPAGTSLEEATKILRDDVLPATRGNYLGIVLYTQQSWVQGELTDDYRTLNWVLQHWVTVQRTIGAGSDYGAGLSTALAVLDRAEHPENQAVVVLFSDGGMDGDQQNLADVVSKLNQRGVKVVIVGLGPDEPVTICRYDAHGLYTGDYMEGGQIPYVSVDDANLVSLAAQTGGTYIRIRPGDHLDVNWAAALAGGKIQEQKVKIYWLPLALAMLLIFLPYAGQLRIIKAVAKAARRRH